MRHVQLDRRRGGRGWMTGRAIVAALCVLLAGPAWAGWSFFSNPVKDLQQALAVPIRQPGKNSVELAERKRNLFRCVGQLRSLKELREAVLLQEWRDGDFDESVAQLDGLVRADLARRLEEKLRETLQFGDAASRIAAARLMADLAVSAPRSGLIHRHLRNAAPALTALVRHPNGDVRTAAAEALSQLAADPREAVAVLQRPGQWADVSQRRHAAQAQVDLIQTAARCTRQEIGAGNWGARGDVIQIGRALVPAACKGLSDSDTEVRRLHLQALEQTAAAMSDLIRDVRDTTRDEPALQVAYCHEVETERDDLGPLMKAFHDHTPALTRALGDSDPGVRWLAHHTFENLSQTWQRLQRRAGSLPPALPVIPATVTVAGLPQPARLTPARAPVLAAVPNGAAAALPGLIQGLDDPNVKVRRAALDALETLGPAAAPAVAALVERLSDPDRFVRWAAARTLGKLGPIEAAVATPRLAALLDDSDLDLRLSAAEALRRYGPAARTAVPALAQALGGSDGEVRVAALRALEGIGPAAAPALPAVAAALNDPRANVRRAAAELLGRLGPPAYPAANSLRFALADGDAAVRRAAGDALLTVSPTATEPTRWTTARPDLWLPKR